MDTGTSSALSGSASDSGLLTTEGEWGLVVLGAGQESGEAGTPTLRVDWEAGGDDDGLVCSEVPCPPAVGAAARHLRVQGAVTVVCVCVCQSVFVTICWCLSVSVLVSQRVLVTVVAS
jgi:hypothetical protein